MAQAHASAWYFAPLRTFRSADPLAVLGRLTAGSPFDVTPAQRDAWSREIAILSTATEGFEGWIALEFDIPRLGARVDAVVVTGAAIVPVEFKVGEAAFTPQDLNQAWDYGLDLKNFHEGSHEAAIFPVLCATSARAGHPSWASAAPDGVRPPRRAAAHDLAGAIAEAVEAAAGAPIDGEAWAASAYQPTPTIIEAAQALYARHGVEAISRSDAGARNLAITSRAVEAIIDKAARERFKAIVFLTGVPGAGKTLVGLNVATRRRRAEDAAHAVFLSGNGPLVAVLREALTRDELARLRKSGSGVRKGEVAQRVKPFIQNVHHFRDDGVRTLSSGAPPHDRVVIFDEAQRAWDRAMTADFMKRKKGLAGFDRSEPQFLIEYMDRHPDWAVVVCLVGGGQEINRGEAGIVTWLEAIRDSFPGWQVYVSPELHDAEYSAGPAMASLEERAQVVPTESLHLAVSMRSFRAENVSRFVKAVLDAELDAARQILAELSTRYPIVLTRDLDRAKRWLRQRARGTERYGLVATSGALRLKPHAIDVRVSVDPIHWFLNGPDDTRSSWYLEDPATEYQIQGLELDWVCVSWDADLRFADGGWEYRSFNAKGWQNVNSRDRRRYLQNAYRVLLTRARQGMVLFVSPGDPADPTRQPGFYDATYTYLRELGISTLDDDRQAAAPAAG